MFYYLSNQRLCEGRKCFDIRTKWWMCFVEMTVNLQFEESENCWKLVRYEKIDFVGKVIHQTICTMSFSALYIIHAYFVIISSFQFHFGNIPNIQINSKSRWTEWHLLLYLILERLHYAIVINSKQHIFHLEIQMSHATVTE